MYYWEKVNEALAYIEKTAAAKPELGLILGSGLGELAEQAESPLILPYADIPYWPRSTVVGHEGKLVFGRVKGRSVVFMQGRIHYYEGYTMAEVTFPIRVLGALGVKGLVVTNAAGAVNTGFQPGSIAAITDHINFMGTNPLAGVNNENWGLRFPDMTHAYNREFLKTLHSVAQKKNIALEEGVYMAFSGPSFETPAEIKMARTLGADLVGMSTVPEVIVANHMGIKVLGISCASNFAAGITDNTLTHQEVLETLAQSGKKVRELITGFVEEVKL